MGDAVGVHPLVVIFGVLIGEELYGFIGIILAVPVVVILKETAVYLSERLGWFGLMPAPAGAPADAPDPAPGDTLTGLAPPPRRAAAQPASDAPGEGDTMDVTNVVPTQPPRPTGAE
jgi:hypothetical protein